MAKGDRDFYGGVYSALAVVHAFGQDTIFDEIVGTVGEDELIRVARRDGAMRWSGLSAYLRRTKEASI